MYTNLIHETPRKVKLSNVQKVWSAKLIYIHCDQVYDVDYRHKSWHIDGEDVIRELPLELKIFQC